MLIEHALIHICNVHTHWQSVEVADYRAEIPSVELLGAIFSRFSSVMAAVRVCQPKFHLLNISTDSSYIAFFPRVIVLGPKFPLFVSVSCSVP